MSIRSQYVQGGSKPQLTIATLDQKVEWNVTLSSEEELKNVRDLLDRTPKNSLLKGLIIPIRTKGSFVRDLFLPTFLNQAIKVQNLFRKILAMIGAIFLDFFTLPVRLITALPRVIYNKCIEDAFHKFLRENGAPEHILNQDFVQVTLFWKKEYETLSVYVRTKKEISFPFWDSVPTGEFQVYEHKTRWETLFGRKFENKCGGFLYCGVIPSYLIGHERRWYSEDMLKYYL